MKPKREAMFMFNTSDYFPGCHNIGSIKSIYSYHLKYQPPNPKLYYYCYNFSSMYFKDLEFKSSSMQIHSCVAEIRQVVGTKI